MINLKFLNKAVELTDGNEFRVLYTIANTISLKKEGRTRIYREMLSDMLGLSTKQITRLTNSLEDKGLLRKDLISNGDKTVCYYSLNLDIIDQKSTSNRDKNVPLNNSKKELIKEKRVNNRNKSEKEEKVDVKMKFKTECNVDFEEALKSTEENRTVSNDFFNDFKNKVDSKLVGENENELLEIKTSISTELMSKTMEIGSSTYNRCSSYLNRKYQEATASFSQ